MTRPLDPGTRLGPYEIESLLGAGGMGHVYRAHDRRLSRWVAIKTLSAATTADPELAGRFASEARLVGSLQHPNLLVVFDVGREGDVAYLVSELLEGETVRERLRRQGALSQAQAVDIIRQVGAGLAAAHARGIVHRDLKPENLFLTRDRRVKILDFGIAKRVELPEGSASGTLSPTLTVTGAIVGTPGYMAPEQVLGGTVDQRADLFALGAVLFELLVGEAPFARATSIATLSATVAEDPLLLPPIISPALGQLLQRLLAKSPEERLQSAHDLDLALDLISGSGAARSLGGILPASRGLSRRALVGNSFAAAALMGLGGVAGALLAPRTKVSGVPAFRRVTFRRGLIRAARFGSDGTTVLLGARWDGDRCRVYSARIGAPESGVLDLPDANLLAVSRTGELALALGEHAQGIITYGTLATVPAGGGEPRERLVDVKFADWSPDGKELAVVRQQKGIDQLEYPIGRVLVPAKVGDYTGLGFPRISADGRRVAYVEYRDPGSLVGRLCIVDGDGTITRLTGETINVHGLVWRGEELWFTAAEEEPLFRALRAVSLDGATRTVLRLPGNATVWDALPDGRLLFAQVDDRAVLVIRRPGEQIDRDLSWLDASIIDDVSTDGRQLLFTESGQGGGATGTMYLRDVDRRSAIRLGSGCCYALSPDAQWVACSTEESGPFVPSPALRLLPTGPGESRRIEGNGLGFLGARFLPDGRHLVALAVRPDERARLYRVELAGGRIAPLTPDGVLAWALAPDGAAVAVLGADGGITRHFLDGSPAQAFPGVGAGDEPVAWINQGLLVVDREDPAWQSGRLYLVDPRAETRTTWADLLPQDPGGLMMLTRIVVTPDGGTRACTWHRALSTLYVASGLA